MSLLALGYKRYIPTFNKTTYLTRAGDSAKKCSSLLATPNMVVMHGRVHISFIHQFQVDTENDVLCHKPGMPALFFRIREISGAEH